MQKFQNLKVKISEKRAKILQFKEELSQLWIGEDFIPELALLSLVAGEPILLIGEAGSGKEMLIEKISQAFPIQEGELFTYTLTPFTEPAEVFGLLDTFTSPKNTKKVQRHKKGTLLQAKIAFFNEIFHASSCLLNGFLEILDRGRFSEGGRSQELPLEAMFFGASQFPSSPEHHTFLARIPLVIPLDPLFTFDFEGFIVHRLSYELSQHFQRQSWTFKISWEDLQDLRDYLYYLMIGGEGENPFYQGLKEDIQNYWEEGVFSLFQRMILSFRLDHSISISDVQVLKLYKLLRCYAFLYHGGSVQKEDLRILAYMGHREREWDLLKEEVPRILALEQL